MKKIKGPISMTVCSQVELKIFIKKATIYKYLLRKPLYTNN